MGERSIALFLVDETNEFQQLLRTDAEAAAARAGLSIETYFSGIDFAAQLSLIQRRLDSGDRPAAILVMCVNDRGLERVARRAAHAGVHVLFLNASADDLEAVRHQSPGTAVGVVCPDEKETGRIQGRQLRRLLPRGGRVLYVQGRARSEAARDRTAGVMSVMELGSSGLKVMPLEAGWTAQDGREAVGAWLRMALRVNRHLDLIACQNDMLAQGVLEALREVAADLGRPEIARIPVTGCDGSPRLGQMMVRRGELRATVILPRATGPAVEAVARALRTGELPQPVTLLKPVSFPTEVELGLPAVAGRARTSGGLALAWS